MWCYWIPHCDTATVVLQKCIMVSDSNTSLLSYMWFLLTLTLLLAEILYGTEVQHPGLQMIPESMPAWQSCLLNALSGSVWQHHVNMSPMVAISIMVIYVRVYFVFSDYAVVSYLWYTCTGPWCIVARYIYWQIVLVSSHVQVVPDIASYLCIQPSL